MIISFSIYLKNHQKRIVKTCLLFLVSLIVISPQFFVNGPNLIDDGVDLTNARVESNYLNIFVDNLFASERTTPIKLIFQKARYDLFGMNIGLYFILNSVLLFILLSLVVKICETVKINSVIQFFSLVAVLLLPSLYGNFYRLGTPDHLFSIFLLIFLYSLLNKRILFALLSFFCLLLTKEYSVFYFPMLVVLIFREKKWKVGVLSIGLYFLLFSLIIMKLKGSFSDENRYISKSLFDLTVMYGRVVNFYLFRKIEILVYGYALILALIIFRLVNKSSQRILTVLVILSACYIPTFLFWDVNQNYYLLPMQLALIILVAFIVQLVSKLKLSKLLIPFPLLFLLFVHTAMTSSLREIYSWNKDYVLNGELAHQLLMRNNDKTFFSDITNYEENNSIYIFASHLKSNEIVFYPDIAEWLNKGMDDNVYRQTTALVTRENFINEKQRSLLVTENQEPVLVKGITNISLICGESILFSKECRYYIYEKESY